MSYLICYSSVMLNEFTAKKLGEVLAFSVVQKEIFAKGSDALSQVLGTDRVSQVTQSAEGHVRTIIDLATTEGVETTTLPKSEKTGDKLRQMLDLYVGDQWDNPAELLEWLGFFEGAALIHWKLVEGTGVSLNDPRLQGLSKIGVDFHQGLLTEVANGIKELGGKKATA